MGRPQRREQRPPNGAKLHRGVADGLKVGLGAVDEVVAQLHAAGSAVDDHSRLAYSEIHTDERKETATGFWQRAHAFFAVHGITVERALTDNGACYESFLWRQTLAATAITHKRTRPYRPQTNGKVERFNPTLLDEWAYLRPCTNNDERTAALAGFLHTYNHHRCHTALGGHPPISRVNNAAGQYT